MLTGAECREWLPEGEQQLFSQFSTDLRKYRRVGFASNAEMELYTAIDAFDTLTHCMYLTSVLRAQNIALIQIRLDILKTQDMGPLPSPQCQCGTTWLEVQPLFAGSGNWRSRRAVSAD